MTGMDCPTDARPRPSRRRNRNPNPNARPDVVVERGDARDVDFAEERGSLRESRVGHGVVYRGGVARLVGELVRDAAGEEEEEGDRGGGVDVDALRLHAPLVVDGGEDGLGGLVGELADVRVVVQRRADVRLALRAGHALLHLGAERRGKRGGVSGTPRSSSANARGSARRAHDTNTADTNNERTNHPDHIDRRTRASEREARPGGKASRNRRMRRRARI